jgi:hypothetical protein
MTIVINAHETRPEILELVARANASPGSDEAHFLGQLRAALADIEGRVVPFRSRPRCPRLGVGDE